MSIISSDILAGASGQAGGAPAGYTIERSLRFNSADSAYLDRTPSSAGDRKTWTWSGWVKRSSLTAGDFQTLFCAGDSGSANRTLLRFNFSADDCLISTFNESATWNLYTTAVFRDVSAWYHVVLAVDTTQATAADRVKLYVNGVAQTLSGTQATLNELGNISNNKLHYVGNDTRISTFLYDGYLADVQFIDGQALDPTDFGEFDDNGVWQPIEYTGTYGTNGFHLDFSDNSTDAALGTDTSGNSNTWTVNNISVTAGAGNDSLLDSPQNGTQTDTGAGGEVSGNYCTWNPLKGAATLANGNLEATTTSAGSQATVGTIGISSGKWYWEVTLTVVSGTSAAAIGIADNSFNATNYVGNDAGSWGYYSFDGNKYNNGSGSAYGNTYGSGDVIGVAFDADAGSLYFYKNGTIQNSGTAAFTGLTAGPYKPAVGDGTSSGEFTFTLNAGQRAFAYSAPSGYKALCTTNLPDPTIADGSDYMDVALYTGTGSSLTVSGLGFSPDFVWLKNRGNAASHRLTDIVRGATKSLFSDSTTAELTETGSLTAFTSDGFTLGTGGGVNNPGTAAVAWTWDAGTSNTTYTAGVTPGAGSISSVVRANPNAGFSIVTWTGNGTSGATIGHGLNAVPEFAIFKARNTVDSWSVFHKINSGTNGNLTLNSTNAIFTSWNVWNSTAPSSSVFTLGNDTSVNTNNNDYVAYCFAPVEGYSAFGSYVGNGSADGPFVYTGFRPRWIMTKRTDTTGEWWISDSARDTYNAASTFLWAQSSGAEVSSTSYDYDILSNGFKLKTTYADRNASGGTFVYIAFAENPFKTARAR